MEIRNLGRSGLRVSAIGLGCNNFGGRIDLEATRKVIHKAIDLGITLFDTADVYGNRGGSETLMGQVLGDRRKDIVLATKYGMAMSDDGVKKGGSRRYVMAAVEDSLRRLKTDWIDLYQLHAADPLTPVEETLRALDDLVRAGKVRYFGVSNMPAWQVVEAQWTSRECSLNAFISCQDELSLVMRGIDRDIMPMAQNYGMGVLPYFPLASGLLTGKYRQGAPLPAGSRLSKNTRHAAEFISERNWRIVGALEAFAQQRGRSLLELAFSWLLHDPVVASVIAGATSPAQVEQNIAAAGWTLLPEDLQEIDRITL